MKEYVKYPPVVCIDFDGVIHSYVKPWVDPSSIPDPPVEGAFAFIEALHANGYRVVILSARAQSLDGREAIYNWLVKHNGPTNLEITSTKPGAKLYIDDRGFRFCGQWPTLSEVREMGENTWNSEERKKVAEELSMRREV